MLRSILSVIVGFIAMLILGTVLYFGVLFAFGKDQLFQPDTYKYTTTLNVLEAGLNVVVGLFGGLVCAKIARSPTPVKVSAAIALVVGLGLAVWDMYLPEPGARPADMHVLDIFADSKPPVVLSFVNAFIGAACIMLGGTCCASLCKKKT